MQTTPLARIATARVRPHYPTVRGEHDAAPAQRPSLAEQCALLALEYARISGRPVCPGVAEFLAGEGVRS
jgi:hypothetical protein